MQQALWKYILSALLVGFSWVNTAEAHTSVPQSVQDTKQHLDQHVVSVLECPMDLVETTVSQKFSAILIEVPHVRATVRIPDHTHAGAHCAPAHAHLPSYPLYLFYRVFLI
jgi:hypothetical protein